MYVFYLFIFFSLDIIDYSFGCYFVVIHLLDDVSIFMILSKICVLSSILGMKLFGFSTDMDVSPIYCTILLNFDLKTQHQFNDRLFRFFYLYGLLFSCCLFLFYFIFVFLLAISYLVESSIFGCFCSIYFC